MAAKRRFTCYRYFLICSRIFLASAASLAVGGASDTNFSRSAFASVEFVGGDVGPAAVVIQLRRVRELRHELGQEIDRLGALLVVDEIDRLVDVGVGILDLLHVDRVEDRLRAGLVAALHQQFGLKELQLDVGRFLIEVDFEVLEGRRNVVFGGVGSRDESFELVNLRILREQILVNLARSGNVPGLRKVGRFLHLRVDLHHRIGLRPSSG